MATIRGFNYSEDIDGTDNNDLIDGNGGDDIIRGLGSDDDLYGNSGNDDLWGGTGDNTLWGGTGDDYFVMSARNPRSFSYNFIGDFRQGEDTIDVRAWGVSDFSQLQMLLKNNSDGNATFNANYGGKINTVEIGEYFAKEIRSDDFVFSNAGSSQVLGTSAADTLFGSRSADEIEGGKGADTLLGGRGNDVIYGDDGNDFIVGGAGQDTMSGNRGEDVFVFASASETAVGRSRDVIRDFMLGDDTIDLRRIDALPKFSGDQEFDWIGRDSFDAAGQVRYYYSDGKTIIQGSTDTDRAAEFEIALQGTKPLLEADFIL